MELFLKNRWLVSKIVSTHQVRNLLLKFFLVCDRGPASQTVPKFGSQSPPMLILLRSISFPRRLGFLSLSSALRRLATRSDCSIVAGSAVASVFLDGWAVRSFCG